MIYSYGDLEKLRKALKGKRVIFVSGCFDILHEGHVQFLEKAATFGDVLVVGVLADAYIRAHKKRNAILSQKKRAYLVHDLKPVTHVVCTPYIDKPAASMDVLRILRPTYFVKREKIKQYYAFQEELDALRIKLKLVPMKKVNSSHRIIHRAAENDF